VITETISAALTWAILLLVPPVAGYWLGKVRSPLTRLSLLALLISTPVILLTTAMILLPSAPPSDFDWWMAGIIMITLAIVIWAILAGIGYIFSQRSFR
jgi:sterol desaturase/sphingolipid hydroxylase (fatty acid hydroxylase superfamily)